ncbi:MAG: cell division protein ZapE, partial [Gammaproteobacteria bacterium]
DGLLFIYQPTDSAEDPKKLPVKGLYLWGGVGRGKTCIVDAFFECLPLSRKKRIHFHRFMQKVHHELKQLHNDRDPLQIVADIFAKKATVICFDEFHVSDITDAMLLGGLLKALFERGVTLVATSNEHPDQLYSDGLQRKRFLPAIELIKAHTQVVEVESGIDYRLRYLDKAEIYHQPLNGHAERMLRLNFDHMAPDQGKVNGTIEIEGRKIRTVRCADGVVWFDFMAICDGPRGAADYIEIGCQFQTVLIANVPRMDDQHHDRTKRFMTLVDEFYDRNVKLFLSAADSPDNLYLGKRFAKQFKRTSSRLVEMQSHDYLGRQHLSE